MCQNLSSLNHAQTFDSFILWLQQSFINLGFKFNAWDLNEVVKTFSANQKIVVSIRCIFLYPSPTVSETSYIRYQNKALHNHQNCCKEVLSWLGYITNHMRVVVLKAVLKNKSKTSVALWTIYFISVNHLWPEVTLINLLQYIHYLWISSEFWNGSFQNALIKFSQG